MSASDPKRTSRRPSCRLVRPVYQEVRAMIRLALLIAMLSVASCSVVADQRDWDFVQSVGGIAFDSPVQGSGGWILPVQADVSGIRPITVKPTLLNSALACKSVEASVDGRVIYLTLVTGVVSQRRTPICPAAELGWLDPGSYSVIYRGPDRNAVSIGEVVVGH